LFWWKEGPNWGCWRLTEAWGRGRGVSSRACDHKGAATQI
jgi:hypothetical protein